MMSLRYAAGLIIIYSVGAIATTLALYGGTYILFERVETDRMASVISCVALAAVLGQGALLLVPRFRYRFARKRIGIAAALSTVIALIIVRVMSPVALPLECGFWATLGFWFAVLMIFSGPYLVGWVFTALIFSPHPDVPGPKDVAAFD